MRENQEGSLGWILQITYRIGIDIGYIMSAGHLERFEMLLNTHRYITTSPILSFISHASMPYAWILSVYDHQNM